MSIRPDARAQLHALLRRSDDATTARQGWWTDANIKASVLTALAASDTMKQAWTRLRDDGTLAVSYPQFTRQLADHLEPAVKAGLTGDGREDYLKASIYCTDTVAHRTGPTRHPSHHTP